MTDRATNVAGVSALRECKRVVEPAIDHVLFLVRIVRLEQACAQRWREREREERGEAHRHRNRQRELTVDCAGAAGLHRARDKDCCKHNRNRDHRAGDLAHCLARGIFRRQAFLGHDAFDVLDHHDRIVDDDADREHHAEQTQLVDGEAKRPHAEESAHQRNRNHQSRDQRNAEVLQEDQHHQKHEADGDEQRLHHFLDRDLDEVGGVVRHEPRHARGESRLQFGELGFDRLGHAECVCARQQLHAKTRSRGVVVLERKTITGRTDLDACHVFQAHRRAVDIRSQQDVLELFRRTEAAFGAHRRSKADTGRRRFRTDRTRGDLYVLAAHRGQCLRGGHAVSVQLVWIQPDAHRIFRTELERVADTLNALNLIEHLRGDDIVELVGIF